MNKTIVITLTENLQGADCYARFEGGRWSGRAWCTWHGIPGATLERVRQKKLESIVHAALDELFRLPAPNSHVPADAGQS